MGWGKVWGVAAATLLAAGGAARAEGSPGLHVERRVEYYEAQGGSMAELNAFYASRRAHGVEWAGQTRYPVQISVPADRGGRCRVDRAAIEATVTVVLPRLAPGVRLADRDTARWQVVIERLTAHEEEHERLTLEALPEVLEAIRGSTCGGWRAAAHRRMSQLDADQDDFDRRTDHGRRDDAGASPVRTRAEAAPARPARTEPDDFNGVPVEWTVGR